MQGDTDELIIEITPDVEVPEVVAEKPVVADKPVKAAVETPAIEPIEDLRKQLETMRTGSENDRAARLRAEDDARRATETANRALDEAAKAKTDIVDTELSAVESAIDAAKTEADSAEAEYQAAFEAGDGKRMAQAQRRIATAVSRLGRLDEGKADLEVRRNEEPKPAKRADAPAKSSDPFEAAIASVTPKSQAWLRAHPEYVKDPSLNRKANAAHNMAIADGHAPDTDGYFEYCETFLGLKETPAKPAVEKPATTRTRPMPSAPVSRESASMNGSLTPTQVVLTKGEQLAATDGTLVHNFDDPKGRFKKGDAIGVTEMARRKLALQKQGAYDRSYVDN